ncbi:hypothetical protein [Burkholderia gladioli]|uniref:hypothetical protein n=1 Tax=Burkholderia gladioli TaxID=28095 RepID=UPI001640859D|nr:hypothetical protein [Burkholderia gladioli]
MTLRDLAERGREAARVVAKSELVGPPCPPLHRLNRQLNREASQAGHLDDGTSPITRTPKHCSFARKSIVF